ncbi:hypothetical protein CCMSSC00406_0008349 [Pleurotus cornucopiae]|uniref:Uncharacterized protein n=1 Tax=Pleurotus cornucopiae TaxID=5321 RepID=A0ACB7J6W5_PLECO|nr:hypothetical protein CCMSSC00406_0008349 [Pleurotus cornucopiae]
MSITLLVSVIPILILFVVWRWGNARELNLPPGPPRSFIIGNAREFPRFSPFIQLTEWAMEYGDIYSLKLLNKTIIVLSSGTTVKEVLDRNGMKTGGRPEAHIVRRVEGKIHPVFDSIDVPMWKASRKTFHAFLTSQALESYFPMQQERYLRLLRDILTSPKDVVTHTKRLSVSIMVALVYGQSADNARVDLFYRGMKRLTQLADPFANPPVDLFPILKYVPARWASWKPLSDETKAMRKAFHCDLVASREEAYLAGERVGCYMEKVLDRPLDDNLTREEVRVMCRVLVDGGIETQASYLQTLVLSLACYPEYQSKAQAEMDLVVGDERLPTLEDFDDLPYVRAFTKEVQRFRPILPIVPAHVASQDVRYGDYVIPKDALILMNTWGIYHDPELFEEPYTFNPERYLHSEFGVKEGANVNGFRENLPFGAGRRVCPGAEMASRTIAMNAMNLIWAFNFAKDGSGTCNIDLDNYLPGLELAPKPFTCDITPRNAKRAQMILNVTVAHG